MAGKQYKRDMDGLIDACFDQLQDLRDGISNTSETTAFAKTAELIIRAAEADVRRQAMHYMHEQRMLELRNQRLGILTDARNPNAAGDTESDLEAMGEAEDGNVSILEPSEIEHERGKTRTTEEEAVPVSS